MKYTIINFCTVILFFFTSCTLFQTYTIKTEDLTPRETDVPGWRLDMSPATYDSNDLSEYIKNPEFNRLYRTYGFKELSVARYISFSSQQRKILVEIFQMDSSLNAFGIFSMERSGEIKKADICNESYLSPLGLFSNVGTFYIRIQSNTHYNNLHNDLKYFIRIIYVFYK